MSGDRGEERRTEKWINAKDPFVLTIGIDDYPHATKLRGARADADRFVSFLRQQMKVKNDRIINLRNEGATRAAIVEAFRSLWKNKSIHRDDPIVIYFAGHGCKICPPKGWETGGRDEIEGIFPYDVEPRESNARSIFPIPDRTIGVWLDILSHEKGNNITVIFDCCHSASGARASGPELVRAQEFYGSIPDHIDKDSFDIEISPEFLYQHSRSHVFLAACGATEYAREEHGKGKFTEEFLKVLEKDGVDDLSYVEFMKCMEPIARQTPQCEGHFKNRMLFSNIMKIGWGLFRADIYLKSNSNKTTYCIHAGSIHGVDENSLFDLYETAAIDTQTNKPICRLRVQNVSSLRTIGVVDHSEMKPAIAGFVRQVRSGKPLKVHFSTAFLGVVSERSVTRHAGIDGKIEVVKDARTADFIVDARNGNALFTTSLKQVTDHGFRVFPEGVLADPKSVSRVLLTASRWKQHLEIPSPEPWIKNVHIEFFPLKSIHDQWGTHTLQRMGTCQLNNKDNIVYINVQPDNYDFYGMVIRNETELALHLTIVKFNIDNLEIEPYFSGAIGVHVNGDADPFLPPKKHLTIGYGSSGATPFMFNAPKDGGNVTILKVYLTTIPLDLGWLKQDSPFSTPRSSKSRDEVKKLMMVPSDPRGATTLVTIVQSAHPVPN